MKVIFFSFLLRLAPNIENAQVKGPYQDVTGHEHVHPAAIGRASRFSLFLQIDCCLCWEQERIIIFTQLLKRYPTGVLVNRKKMACLNWHQHQISTL